MMFPLVPKKDKKKAPEENAIAISVATQAGLVKDPDGTSPVTDYIIKKQIEANKSPQAKQTHPHYTPKGKK